MVEHSLGSPDGLEADCMLAAGLVLPQGLAVADWPVLLGSSLSPHLAQCCLSWLKNGGRRRSATCCTLETERGFTGVAF
jgi:hypothetical protein